MDTSIGVSQTSLVLTNNATTSPQSSLIGRWCSAPIAAQTLGGWASGNFGLGLGVAESNTASLLIAGVTGLVVWRPSTGAVIGRIYNGISQGTASGTCSFGVSSTTETWLAFPGTGFSSNGGSATAQDNDILIVEVWRIDASGQTMATAYTNTIWFDGTTEGSSSSAASYIVMPENIVFMGAAAALQSKPVVASQAVMRAATR